MTIVALALLLAGNAESGLHGPADVPLPSAEAESRFKDGLKAYDDHEYARAIEDFEAAYRASSKPEILFNIAQTYHLLGDCQRALESFDAFIAAVPSDHRLLPRARSRRDEISPCPGQIDTSPHVTASDASVPASAILPAPRAPEPQREAIVRGASPPASRAARSTLRSACMGAAGASAALAGAGIGFGLWARSVQSSVQQSGVWDTAAERADARGEVLGNATTVLLITAGLTATIAAATCVLSRRNTD